MSSRYEKKNTTLPSLFENFSWKHAALGVMAGAGLFVAARYRVASPNERLIRTGLGIKGINITRKCIHWPFQTLRRLNLQPGQPFCIFASSFSSLLLPSSSLPYFLSSFLSSFLS
jgi:hypothetical protein